MSTSQFLVHVSMLIKNAGGKQGVFSHEIRETHKTMRSLLDVDPFLMLEVFALDKNRTNIKLRKSIPLLKTPNFLTVTDMNMSCCHQVTVAVVSKGLYSSAHYMIQQPLNSSMTWYFKNSAF